MMLLSLMMAPGSADSIAYGTGFTGYACPNIGVVNGGSTTKLEQKRLTSTSPVAATATLGIGTLTYYALGLIVSESAGPTLSTISTSALKYLDTGITLTGSGFGASKGTSSVVISPTNNAADANAVTQTTTAWSDTSITFTVTRGALKYVSGTTYYVFVKTSGGNSAGQAVSLNPQTGWSFVDIGTPNTTASNRLTATPDIASGNQVAWGNATGTGTVVVTNAATFNTSGTITGFDFEVNDGTAWGTTATQNLSAYLGAKTKVYVVSATGKKRWYDYIPLKMTGNPLKIGRYDFDGAKSVTTLASPVGTAWVDYIPVVLVTDPDSGRYRFDDTGFIPAIEV